MSTDLSLVLAQPGHTTPQDLISRILQDSAGLEQQLLERGYVKFRGFALRNAKDVEDVALALDPHLASGEYLGTSPRNALTKHVHSASELPGHYPIPQHCEMSFLANPPKRLRRPEDRAMDVTHADGTPIAKGDVEHVRDVIWQHQVVDPWQLGDFVVIDNASTSHGRLPYSGSRIVVVAWS